MPTLADAVAHGVFAFSSSQGHLVIRPRSEQAANLTVHCAGAPLATGSKASGNCFWGLHSLRTEWQWLRACSSMTPGLQVLDALNHP
jgi:hypothetical protein